MAKNFRVYFFLPQKRAHCTPRDIVIVYIVTNLVLFFLSATFGWIKLCILCCIVRILVHRCRSHDCCVFSSDVDTFVLHWMTYSDMPATCCQPRRPAVARHKSYNAAVHKSVGEAARLAGVYCRWTKMHPVIGFRISDCRAYANKLLIYKSTWLFRRCFSASRLFDVEHGGEWCSQCHRRWSVGTRSSATA